MEGVRKVYAKKHFSFVSLRNRLSEAACRTADVFRQENAPYGRQVHEACSCSAGHKTPVTENMAQDDVAEKQSTAKPPAVIRPLKRNMFKHSVLQKSKYGKAKLEFQ